MCKNKEKNTEKRAIIILEHWKNVFIIYIITFILRKSDKLIA